jgi:hypothetical protein
VDLEWREYAKWCGAAAVTAPGGGRVWFAVWSSGGSGGGNGRADCLAMHADMLERANRIKLAMQDGSELARRAGVYPGEMRDLRRKYSLDYEW